MSEQNTQGAMVEEVVTNHSTSLEAALVDAAQSGFAPAADNTTTSVISDSSEEAAAANDETPPPVLREVRTIPPFVSRESTDLVYYRRKSNDQRFHYDIMDSSIEQSFTPGDGNELGSPVGPEGTELVLRLLTADTWGYFSALEQEGESVEEAQEAQEGGVEPTSNTGKRPRDPGDIVNLKRLKSFVDDLEMRVQYDGYDPLYDLLNRGIRCINLTDRLLENAQKAKTECVKGTITISYQVPGHSQIFKYRLVGDITTNLINAIREVGGDIVKSFDKPAVKAPKKTEQQQKEKPNQTANEDRSNLLSKDRPISRSQEGVQLSRLMDMMEAQIVDMRKLNSTVYRLEKTNQDLQHGLRVAIGRLEELEGSNDQIINSLSAILTAVEQIQ